jgi:mono/diheme cytochrome c family protein
VAGIRRKLYVTLVVSLMAALVLVACGGAPPAPVAQQAEEAEHVEEGEHEDEHMHGVDEHMSGAGHDVPDEAAAVPNPIDANDQSVEAGAALYAANCAVCHGETGEGDGPTAETLEQKPADLHEDHVQDLSDGALFYIISHGRPETPMPAWEEVLSEEERWHVVNFVRTFSE